MIYAYIANGYVLYTKEFKEQPQDSAWREVVEAEVPESDPDTQELVATGWKIDKTTATRTFVVLDRPKPDAEIVRADPEPEVESKPVTLDTPAVADVLKGATQQIDPKVSGLFVAFAAEIGLSQEQIDRVFEKALA